MQYGKKEKMIEYLEMLNNLEDHNAINKIILNKKDGIYSYEFHVKTSQNKRTNKYKLKMNACDLNSKFMDLYNRHNTKKENKLKKLKIVSKRFASFAAAGTIIVGSIAGIGILSNKTTDYYMDIADETKKVINQMKNEDPNLVVTTELQQSIYNQIEQQKREEFEQNNKNSKDKNDEKVYEEKILSTGENLDEYMAKTFENNTDNPVYQAYLEYKNKNNNQENQENASKTR